MKRFWKTVCVILAICIIIGLGNLTIGGTAFRAEDEALDALNVMGIVDAKHSSETEDRMEEMKGARYICYMSDRLGMVLSFDTETGQLCRIDNYSIIWPERNDTVSTNSMPMSAQERETASLNTAQMMILPYQIGELCLRENPVVQLEDWYEYEEFYEGKPTGTTVTLVWEGNELLCAIANIGEIYKKDASGNVTSVHTEPMITEDAAVEIALEALQQDASLNGDELIGDQVECELVLSQGIYQYEVKVWVRHDYGPEFDIHYIAYLDAYTGEVTGTGQTA